MSIVPAFNVRDDAVEQMAKLLSAYVHPSERSDVAGIVRNAFLDLHSAIRDRLDPARDAHHANWLKDANERFRRHHAALAKRVPMTVADHFMRTIAADAEILETSKIPQCDLTSLEVGRPLVIPGTEEVLVPGIRRDYPGSHVLGSGYHPTPHSLIGEPALVGLDAAERHRAAESLYTALDRMHQSYARQHAAVERAMPKGRFTFLARPNAYAEAEEARRRGHASHLFEHQKLYGELKSVLHPFDAQKIADATWRKASDAYQITHRGDFTTRPDHRFERVVLPACDEGLVPEEVARYRAKTDPYSGHGF